jgi:hypothetical protein
MVEMSDQVFLLWLADRLTHEYKEPPQTDFVLRLIDIAVSLPMEQKTFPLRSPAGAQDFPPLADSA